jgi:hypothetical protein
MPAFRADVGSLPGACVGQPARRLMGQSPRWPSKKVVILMIHNMADSGGILKIFEMI